MLRSVVGAGMLVLAMGSALQANEPGPGDRISCSEVRYYVEKYTAAVAESYARSQGATDAQINRARRCLMVNHFRRADRSRIYSE